MNSTTAKFKPIYLNANGTTMPCENAINETIKWMYKYDTNSTENKEMVEDVSDYILNLCNTDASNHCVIFTSGASESNSTIIRSVVDQYILKHSDKPHIIISEIEHKSIIMCCQNLFMQNIIEYSMISPLKDGTINPLDVEYAIKKNTCLVSIMYSNNETGAINNIKSINKICKKYKIPFHSDAVQMFGKEKINVNEMTAISMSFHKLYFLKGIGLLIIDKKFMESSGLKCVIAGTQQYGYRGGTMPHYLIAGSKIALIENFTNRDNKNKNILFLKNYMIEELNKIIKIVYYSDNNYHDEKLALILFGSKNNQMVNTCLFSVYSPIKKFCNMNLKTDLEKENIIVSIGSNCNADSPDASHVLNALKVDSTIKRGTVRISLSDFTIKEDIDAFLTAFIKCIDKQIKINSIIDNKIEALVKKIKFKNNLTEIFYF